MAIKDKQYIKNELKLLAALVDSDEIDEIEFEQIRAKLQCKMMKKKGKHKPVKSYITENPNQDLIDRFYGGKI